MAQQLKVSDQTARYGRAWYWASIADFVVASPTEVLGQMTAVTAFDLQQTQRDAWLVQTSILQSQLKGLSGAIFFEYSIPRMGRRIDVVLLIGSVLFVIEFKVGEASFDRVAREQVWDYALDLKNFHQASHTLPIVPILIATEAIGNSDPLQGDPDGVYRPIRMGSAALRQFLDHALVSIPGTHIDVETWAHSPYRPTPSIIEAARALYAKHSVEEIARFDAGAQNLARTSARVESLVDYAKREQLKIICFVTGVPGAGKTLVGLNVANQRRELDTASHAVFLSGNGPLVAVLREALTRDEVKRRAALGEKVRKNQVGESVKAFIQNVHHFRDDALEDLGPPSEHVVIFDEAQRAWNLRKTATFMKMKKGRPNFPHSEPEFLISCMDRRQDWSVIVCL
ncbi:MAG: DNA/RNA helicase domain-containing protein, partial [Usitatibacter sp.]